MQNMTIGSSIRVALNSDLESLVGDAGPHLKTGDHLRLRVVEMRTSQLALVDFGRFRVLAEVAFPAAVGDELVVKVIDAQKGQLHLGVVEAPGGKAIPAPQWNAPLRPFADETLKQVRVTLERLLAFIGRFPNEEPDHMGLSQLLFGLRSFLESLEPGSGGEHVSQRLQAWCADSGVFFEKRLEAALRQIGAEADAANSEAPAGHPRLQSILAQDLKARLAMILHLLRLRDARQSISGAREAAEFARSVEKLLSDIRHQQAEIVRRWNASDPFQTIHFPLPLNDISGRARLKIGFPRAIPSQRRSGFRAALLLEFDALGKTRIDLLLTDRCLSASFFVETARAKAFVEENAHQIYSVLSPFFEYVEVNVRVSEKKIADFEFEDMQAADARRLDVRA